MLRVASETRFDSFFVDNVFNNKKTFVIIGYDLIYF